MYVLVNRTSQCNPMSQAYILLYKNSNWQIGMGALGRYGFFIVSTLGLFSAIFWTYISQVPPLPEIKPQWWGPGQPRAVDRSIRPFKINVSDEVLDDLQDRLELLTTLTPPLEGIGFQYGFNTKYLQEEVVEYWKTKYNWREQERFLNKFPQFKTCVDGLDIHFIHVKPISVPEGTEVLPLLLLHGWPGSVREFYEIIPHLVKPQAGYNFVFEVIVPSLPGYGFSDGAAKPGLGAAQIAVIMKNLMERIGMQKFIVQGGDWGAVIASNMATLFPENVKGLHSNACFVQSLKSTIKLFLGSLWPTFVVEKDYVDKVYPLWEHFQFLLEESGYLHLQATKPDTIGVALRDSPAGLAAYILEKFSTWTNPAWKSSSDGGLTKKFSLTKLLDNIMIYWVTGSITTSARLYSETFTKAQMALELDSIPTAVPSGCTNAPNELMYLSESLLRDKYVNLIHFSHMKAGGHFLAFEEPQLLADDIWQFVKKLRNIAK
ncbi:juvenile hormone epoxide hydrolase 1-like isoform X3 [Schistocerca gregaria]|uniref:juvenile hormone epoxide hydrolase 1-like isoform X3 n=1 Tax=Schistocerca gregaria TaxID=7010 RepID=UPI00211ECD71|nr:juvenile hormone epoxide hydrolase 1-like isoform X3 [Schistocerca gregaria]